MWPLVPVPSRHARQKRFWRPISLKLSGRHFFAALRSSFHNLFHQRLQSSELSARQPTTRISVNQIAKMQLDVGNTELLSISARECRSIVDPRSVVSRATKQTSEALRV